MNISMRVADSPIPKALLPDSATLLVPSGNAVAPAEPIDYQEIELENVRIIVGIKTDLQKETGVRRASGIFYYDAVNSIPANVEFSTDCKLRYNGCEYSFEKISAVKGAQKLHHIKAVIY